MNFLCRDLFWHFFSGKILCIWFSKFSVMSLIIQQLKSDTSICVINFALTWMICFIIDFSSRSSDVLIRKNLLCSKYIYKGLFRWQSHLFLYNQFNICRFSIYLQNSALRITLINFLRMTKFCCKEGEAYINSVGMIFWSKTWLYHHVWERHLNINCFFPLSFNMKRQIYLFWGFIWIANHD